MDQSTGRHLPIAQAAKELGLSTSAMRQRVKRGSIPACKGKDGYWYVLVDEAARVLELTQGLSNGSNNGSTHGTLSDSIHVTKQPPSQGHPRTGPDPLVERLTNEVEFLRKELEQRAEELRRKDIMLAEFARSIAELKHRLPELPATTSTAKMAPEAGPLQSKPSWWRRLLYGAGA